LAISLGIAFCRDQNHHHSTLTSFKNSVERWLEKRKTLAVTGGESGFPEQKLDVVAAIPGVKHAVPIVQARAYSRCGWFKRDFDGHGVDLLREQGVRTYKTTDEQVIAIRSSS